MENDRLLRAASAFSFAGETNGKQMERLTTCPVCLDKFRTPKVLPCMHTFCLTPCLTNLADPRARSVRCPECRREHPLPPGGVQALPANLTMIGFLDLQPATSNPSDRCFVCHEEKPTLGKCHDCSNTICADCREAHAREATYQISTLVSQLRRTLPKLSDTIASYEQRVNRVKVNHEQIERDITAAMAALMEELTHRKTALFTEAEVYMQSQLRMFRLQQETAEVELASVASFCESAETSFSSGSAMNDVDLANLRAQCNRYNQQINTLQTQIPPDVQNSMHPIQLRFTSEHQAKIIKDIQDFGRLVDLSREQHTPPSPPPPAPSVARDHHVITTTNSTYGRTPSYNDYYRRLDDLYYSGGSAAPLASQTLPYRPNHFSGSVGNPFVDLDLTLPNPPYRASWNSTPARRASSLFAQDPYTPVQRQPQRNYVTSTTAARSLEGDDRPIFGGRGSGGERNRPAVPSIPEQPAPERQRSGTFVLDEPSLPDLPQSGAQRPRDTVVVQELYNVRARDRAQTPVAFTISVNDAAQPSETSDS